MSLWERTTGAQARTLVLSVKRPVAATPAERVRLGVALTAARQRGVQYGSTEGTYPKDEVPDHPREDQTHQYPRECGRRKRR